MKRKELQQELESRREFEARLSQAIAELEQAELQETQEYEQRLDQSLQTLEALLEEQQISAEQADDILQALVAIAREVIHGDISRDTLQKIWRLLNLDAEISQTREKAFEEGRLAERNARIEDYFIDLEKKTALPQPAGTPSIRPKTLSSIFDLARAAH